MKFWTSVVGKLWATIIGLVAVVLLINSLFMGQFIDNTFANKKDQEVNLQKMAVNLAIEAPLHLQDAAYLQIVNDLLGAQDAAMILLNSDFSERLPVKWNEAIPRVPANGVFSTAQLNEIMRGGIVSSPVRSHTQFVAVGVPMMVGGEVQGALILYQKQISLENTQTYFKKLFLYAIIVGFLLTTFFAFFLSTRITKPLLQMKQAADLIAEGDYGSRVPVVTSDEIGQLANTFNHMTERLQATITDLNHEKEHLSSILNSMTDAVITFDAGGKVILANPQGDKIIREWNDLSWDEPVSSSPEFHYIPEPLRPLFDSAVGGSKQFISKVHVHNEVWSVVMAPLYSQESRDQVRGAVAVLRDVTEEYRLDKLRKDFVANVSHELRTPLSMLQGYSEALIDDIAATPEERKELVQVIHDESLRMGRLVKDLLDLARMETGNMEFNFREIEIKPMIQRVYRKFSVLCKERNIMLKMEIDDAPLVLMKADEDRLEQVLTNLLDNAMRHTSTGGEIAIRARPVLTGKGPALLAEVDDKGEGIPIEDLPYVFERFYKADKARTRGSAGGTGLGLAIVKNIVEAHNGKVNVTSKIGQGTTFSLILPNLKA